MKPEIKWYRDSIIEVMYIDGIQVVDNLYSAVPSELKGFMVYGSQKKRNFWFKRDASKLKFKTVWIRDVLIISLDQHIMIADNEDFENWMVAKRPLSTRLVSG